MSEMEVFFESYPDLLRSKHVKYINGELCIDSEAILMFARWCYSNSTVSKEKLDDFTQWVDEVKKQNVSSKQKDGK